MNADGILKQDDGKKGYSNGGNQIGTKYNPTAQVFELCQIIKSFVKMENQQLQFTELNSFTLLS